VFPRSAFRVPRSAFGSIDDGEDVFFVHEEDGVGLAALFELIAGPGGEQDDVALLDLEGPAGAVLEEFARTDGQNFALLRLVLGGVGEEEAAGGFFFGFKTLNDEAVA
jgi:hypothetical protein